MIENTAKMAGMPVGPLSLSDEVALDLGLKIMKATEADLGPNAINPEQKKLMVEMVEKQGRFGRKNAKGFYDYPEKGKGQKSLWPGLAALQPKHLDPDTLDVEELKQRFLVVQAVEAARTVEDHVITDPREADVGSILGFGFAPFTGGTLSYIDFMGTKKFVELCHKLESQIRLALHPAEAPGRDGGEGRDLLRPLPAEEAGGAGGGVALVIPDSPQRGLIRNLDRLGVTICQIPGSPLARSPRNDEIASRRLHQAFLGQRFLHLRARGDAGLVGHQVRHAGEVELHPVGPGQHREQIAVGDGELLAHQVVAAGELAVDILELAHQRGP